ncbi:acyloxyacyl hydrolase [bacterium]|nr:acyloxyacyl hydrolase [bacterium]
MGSHSITDLTAAGLHPVRTALFPLVLLVVIAVAIPGRACSEENETKSIRNRYGVSAVLGNTYNPDFDRSFALLSGCAILDYAKFSHHEVPKRLRLKLECATGMTVRPNRRAMASIGMLVFNYLGDFPGGIRPYLEAGIGVIYTDFRRSGQGLRFNFNPRAGLGVELSFKTWEPIFAAIRFGHISNGGFHRDNAGTDFVAFIVGTFF